LLEKILNVVLNSRFLKVALTIFAFLVLLIFLNNYLFAAFSEEYCIRCHVVKPDVVSHKASRHSRVSCFTCHFRSKNFLADNLRYLNLYKCFYSQIFGNYSKPLNPEGDLYLKFDSKICLGCHTEQRDLNPRLGIKINHKAHFENNIICTYCHNRVSHDLQITVREVIKLNLSSNVNYVDRIKMKACMECHTGLKGEPPSRCEACHTQEFKLPYSCNACHAENLNEIKPRDHFVPGFSKKVHASLAKQSRNYCLQCHARDFCDACHQEYKIRVALPEKIREYFHPPSSHFDKSFLPSGHSKEALNRGKDYCFQCHKVTFCDRCHNGLEMPHPEEFKKAHGKIVRREGYTKKCSNCHRSQADFCESGCHHKGWKPSMGPMVRAHPQVVKQTGVTTCLTCHTSIYCAVCHVSGKVKYQFRRE
jgi:hypothetical protein